MPLWKCNYETCTHPAVRTNGECILCARHLCAEHLRQEYHDCPKWEDENRYDPAARKAEESEVNMLISRIESGRLAEYASNIRGGIGASIPALQYDRATRSSVMGGMNYHVDIKFDDGVVWLARIRRFNATSPPLAIQDYIVKSEVATLKFLEETSIPAPKVYGFALSTSKANKLGVGFILMEKLNGRSFDKSTSSKAQMEKMLDQLADIYLELSRIPFSLMGSLDKPDSDSLGFFARESLMNIEGPGITTIGPCASVREYHDSSIRFVMDLILKHEMYTDRPVDAYLIHLFLLDVLEKLAPAVAASPDTNFFLKHADDKGDQILVDDEYNITGIIDWEWAYTAPAELAFNSPILLLPVAEFYEGHQTLSPDEAYLASCFERRGNAQLANYVRNGRIQHFFSFCCGYDLSDWSGFLGLFRGLREATNMDRGIEWDEWKVAAILRYQHDEGLQVLLRAQASQCVPVA